MGLCSSKKEDVTKPKDNEDDTPKKLGSHNNLSAVSVSIPTANNNDTVIQAKSVKVKIDEINNNKGGGQTSKRTNKKQDKPPPTNQCVLVRRWTAAT